MTIFGKRRSVLPSTTLVAKYDPFCVQVQGAAILQSLHGQRETIQRSQQKLHEADENISSSQKILKRMGRWLPF